MVKRSAFRRGSLRRIGAPALALVLLAGCTAVEDPDDFGPSPRPELLAVIADLPAVTIPGTPEGFTTDSAWTRVDLAAAWERLASHEDGCALWTRVRVRVPDEAATRDPKAASFEALKIFVASQGEGEPAASLLLSTGGPSPLGQDVGLHFAATDLAGDLGDGRRPMRYLVRQQAVPVALFEPLPGEGSTVHLLEWRTELAYACPGEAVDEASWETVAAALRIGGPTAPEALGEWAAPTSFDPPALSP